MTDRNIYVGTKGSQTTSAYMVTKNDHVIFHNLGNAQLTVTFDSQESPLCDNNTATGNPLIVGAGGSSAKLKVCQNFNPYQFAYTAEIQGFAAEDPIVIIEKPSGFTTDTTSLLIGAIAGFIAGFVLAKLLKGGKAQNPA